MPPKTATPVLAPARIPPVRKPSTSNVGDKSDSNTKRVQDKDKDKDKDKGSESMGPPPDPPKPQKILEPEMNSLVECLTVRCMQFLIFKLSYNSLCRMLL